MPVPESVVPPAVTNETVEPKLPEAESDEATLMVVSPSIEAPQPSADPAPEVPEVPQSKPEAKLEAIATTIQRMDNVIPTSTSAVQR